MSAKGPQPRVVPSYICFACGLFEGLYTVVPLSSYTVFGVSHLHPLYLFVGVDRTGAINDVAEGFVCLFYAQCILGVSPL